MGKRQFTINVSEEALLAIVISLDITTGSAIPMVRALKEKIGNPEIEVENKEKYMAQLSDIQLVMDYADPLIKQISKILEDTEEEG